MAVFFRWLQIYAYAAYLSLTVFISAGATDHSDNNRLQTLAAQLRHQSQMQKQQLQQWAQNHSISTRVIRPAGGIVEMARYQQPPLFRTTHNLDAARTSRITSLWPEANSTWNLSGQLFRSGMLALWDAGTVYAAHPEFFSDGNRRVRLCDESEPIGRHASHVAGTMVAQGLQTQARGMAFAASLDAYDWWNDYAEMAEAAEKGLLLSNHSYGWITGWVDQWWVDENQDGVEQPEEYQWCWFGDPAISLAEDYLCGFYNQDAATVDDIMYRAPYYLVVKSAGNERSEAQNQGPADGEYFWQYLYDEESCPPYRRLLKKADERPPDGNGARAYDGLEGISVAKNTLTVGAIMDLANGCSSPEDAVMTDFSSWGPTDDGRIKPDLTANGFGLYSCIDSTSTGYAVYSGTSMAAPVVTGSLALLQELHQRTHACFMRSATLKALAIHGADEAGAAPGPDYRFGWGVFNAERCAAIVQQDLLYPMTIQETTLRQGDSITCFAHTTGAEPLKVTLVWTDPPGIVSEPSLDDETAKLVNDLDVRIIKSENGQVYYPWRLNPRRPDAPAQTGDNSRDNVEQIVIPDPGQKQYTIIVRHKQQLSAGRQDLALIITGSDDLLLPVELAEVHAVQDAEGVNLRWATASESDNLGFKIYRSETTSGPFLSITDQIIDGAGNSSSLRWYTWRDTSAISGKSYYYKIADIDLQGRQRFHDVVFAGRQAPAAFHLEQNYPNPFNAATRIYFTLPTSGPVRLKIYSLNGACVRDLINQDRGAGLHMSVWDGCDDAGQPLASGLYIYSLEANGQRIHKKMQLIK